MHTLCITLKTMKPLVMEGLGSTMRKPVYKTPEDMQAACNKLAAFVLENGGSIAQRTDERQHLIIEADTPMLRTLHQTPELMQNIRHMEAIGGAPM